MTGNSHAERALTLTTWSKVARREPEISHSLQITTLSHCYNEYRRQRKLELYQPRMQRRSVKWDFLQWRVMVRPRPKNPNISSAISQVLLKTRQRKPQHRYSKRNNSINPLKRMRSKWT